MVKGICKMCLIEKNLVRSHLIPHAIYAYCRVNGATPVYVGNGIVSASDRETQDYLLCVECEDILSKGGETWVNSKLARMDPRSFPLYDMLVRGPAAYADDTGGIYYARDNPEIDTNKLIHFALGIFWKASVHSWTRNKTDPMIDLGNQSEAVRKWLRGEGTLPRDMSLHISLSKPDRAQIILLGPSAKAPRPWKTFWMHVPGVAFSLNVGPEIPVEMHMLCFWKNSAHVIVVSEDITSVLEERFAQQFAESRKTRSYLASKARRRQPASENAQEDTKPR